LRRLPIVLLLLSLFVSMPAQAQFIPPPDGGGIEPLPSALPAIHTMAWAKTQPDGTLLTEPMAGKVVTRVFPDFGYFYISKPDRSMGIRVKAAECPNPGDIITVTTGVMNTDELERFIDNASYSIDGHGDQIRPLGMSNKSYGGGDFYYDPGPPATGQKGFWDGVGLNNIGSLVRVWGKVTEIDVRPVPLYFYVDDGSGVDMAIDLEVAPGQAIPFTHQIGDYVAFTGISSCLDVDGWHVRVMKLSAPTLKLSKAVGQTDPASKGPIRFKAVFSEPVTGFTKDDVIISGSARPLDVIVTDSGDHKTYTIEVSGMSQAGTVSIRVNHGAAKSINEDLSLASPDNGIVVNYKPFVPYKVLNKRMGIGTGRYQRKPVK